MLNEGIDTGPEGWATGADGIGKGTEELDEGLGGRLLGGPQSKLMR